MPSKKKKYNARFPAGRIKKIMQTDEEVGKVAQAVPVIISRTLELFVESLLTKTLRITNARNAKTLSPSHMKQCIISENRFDFLRDLVKNIPDIGVNEEQLSGSETGYGNETAPSPASTSTSSSNGGATSHNTEASSSGSSLQRSESYTPAGSASYIAGLSQPAHQQAPSLPQNSPTANLAKRTFNHTNSLNFYKEISLDDSSSGTAGCSREPPPKLARMQSAPATANSIPFKIDILPNLPQASNSQQQKLSTNAATNSNNFKIAYKIEPSVVTAPSTPTALEQPIIKLDYSNLKLPMTMTSEQPSSAAQSRQQQLQPTIKIDLSSITNFNTTRQQPSQSPAPLTAAGNSVSVKQVPSTPTASTPSTPLSALSSASSSSASSATSNKSPYTFQHTTAAAQSSSAAPVYSSASSAIPGMDEDYDDI